MLALTFPEMVRSLVLADTTSEYNVEARRLFAQRARTAEERGMEPLIEPTLERWFTPAFRQREPAVVAGIASVLRNTSPQGYAASCRAVAELDLTERLQEIHAPALILVGAHDPSTPVDAARLVQEHLPGSTLEVIPDAAHLSNVEQAEVFNQHLVAFLGRVAQSGPTDDQPGGMVAI